MGKYMNRYPDTN